MFPRWRSQPCGPVRSEADLDEAPRTASAGFVQASGDGDGSHGLHAAAGLETPIHAARPVGPVGQRLVSAYRHLCRRPRRHPQLLGGWPQSRRKCRPDEHRQHPRRSAVPRLVGALRSRQRQRQPPWFRRLARLPGRSARRSAQLVHRLHAGHLPGHALPRRPNARPEPACTDKRDDFGPARQARFRARIESSSSRRARRRYRVGRAHRRLRTGVSHAVRRAGSR